MITPPRAEPAGTGLPTSLGECWPNPFNASTKIRYSLAGSFPTTLEVFDVLGRQVQTLVDEFQPAGIHEVIWDGTDAHGRSVASGMYFYRLRARQNVDSKKMVLLK